jgi:hypothetical protein
MSAENLEGLLLQLDAAAVLAQVTCSEIHFERAEANHSGSRHGPWYSKCHSQSGAFVAKLWVTHAEPKRVYSRSA